MYEKNYSYRWPRYGPKNPWFWLRCNNLFCDFLAWFWKVRMTGVLHWLWWISMQSYSTMHAVVCKYAERTAGRLHQRVHWEGWPLLTVETCWNWDKWGLKGVHMKGASLVGFLGSSCWYKIFLSCLVGLVQNIFSSPYTISLHLSPTPSELGRQSCQVT